MAQIEERPEPSSARVREIAQGLFRHENATLVVALLALIGGLAVVTKGLSIRGANMMNVLLQSSIRGVASIGQAFVMLSAGIDVSIGGIGLMSAILGASLMTNALHLSIVGHPVSMYVAVPIMLLAGASWGAINGLSVSRIGMPALIVTLAMWGISQGVGFQICGGRSIAQLPDALAFLGQGKIVGIPMPVIIFAVVVMIGYFALYHTSFGRSVYAVGGNATSAWLSGIKVKNIQLLVYIVSGFLAGLAGVILTGRVMSASMRTLGGLELDSIAAVCVGGISLAGGRGNLIGAVIGVLIIGVINNGMSILGAPPAMQGIAKGAIIFAAVAIDYIRRRE